jgi:hypothetical protein
MGAHAVMESVSNSAAPEEAAKRAPSQLATIGLKCISQCWRRRKNPCVSEVFGGTVQWSFLGVEPWSTFCHGPAGSEADCKVQPWRFVGQETVGPCLISGIGGGHTVVPSLPRLCSAPSCPPMASHSRSITNTISVTAGGMTSCAKGIPPPARDAISTLPGR